MEKHLKPKLEITGRHYYGVVNEDRKLTCSTEKPKLLPKKMRNCSHKKVDANVKPEKCLNCGQLFITCVYL